MKKLSSICIAFLITSSCLFNSFLLTGEAVSDSAKAAILIDADSGKVLYEHNSKKRLPMASTTKIMSALLAVESGSLDEQFKVDDNAIKVEGSSMGLKSGDFVTQRDLCYGMMLPSGNDAANATAVRVSGSIENFVSLMNKRAKEIGLKSTNFVTPSGLDDYTDNHYSTASDMATLTAYALKNETFAEICSTKSVKLKFGNPPYDRWLSNTNKLIGACEGIIGVKTGFTDKAKRCLVSACRRDGTTLICVTLNDPNDWKDHSNLYEFGFSQYKRISLKPKISSFKVPIVGSDDDTVSASCRNEIKVSVHNDEEDKITQVVVLNQVNYAPITNGEQLGYVNYYIDKRLIGQTEIVSYESVCKEETEPSFFEKLFARIWRAM